MKPKEFQKFGINTRLTHTPYDSFYCYGGFINPPIVRGSTVLFPDTKTMVTEKQDYTYGIHGTPTTDALCQTVREMEGAAKTVLVPSGLAAITMPLLGLLKMGDHLLITDSVYCPTRRFADHVLVKMGIYIEYYDPEIGEDISRLFRSNTKVIFAESPASNTFEIQDILAITSAAHTINAAVVMDNTWASPLYFCPLEHGVDFSIQAATKYLSGHSDILLGIVSANKKYARELEDIYHFLGMCVGSDDAWLALRGIRTMGLRLSYQQETALALAHWLEQHPKIACVLYPALESHKNHSLWKRDFQGASALFSIILEKGDKQSACAFLDQLTLFGLGYSWGGYRSLALHVSLEDRTIAKNKYSGEIIRLHIGLEDFHDLQIDLEKALASLD